MTMQIQYRSIRVKILILIVSCLIQITGYAGASASNVAPDSLPSPSRDSIESSEAVNGLQSSLTNSSQLLDFVQNATELTLAGEIDEDPPPYCYEKSSFHGPVVLSDCLGVARMYKQDHFYSDKIIYTINRKRLGRQADRLMPLDWFADTCLLLIDGMPGTRDQRFSLESEWPRISLLIQKCLVEPQKAEHKVGGIIRIAQGQEGAGFHAVIGAKPKVPQGFPLLVGSNGAQNGTNFVPNMTSVVESEIAAERTVATTAAVLTQRDSTSNDSINASPDDPPTVNLTDSDFGTQETNISASATSPILGDDYDDEPECFDRKRFIRLPEHRDCLLAARKIQADPYYTDELIYSIRNPPSAKADRSLPLIWHEGSCLIFMDAFNDSPDQKLSLQHVWPRFSQLYRKCMLETKVGHAWGGLVNIGKKGENFFFWMGGEMNPRPTSIPTGLVDGPAGGGGGGGVSNASSGDEIASVTAAAIS